MLTYKQRKCWFKILRPLVYQWINKDRHLLISGTDCDTRYTSTYRLRNNCSKNFNHPHETHRKIHLFWKDLSSIQLYSLSSVLLSNQSLVLLTSRVSIKRIPSWWIFLEQLMRLSNKIDTSEAASNIRLKSTHHHVVREGWLYDLQIIFTIKFCI